MWLLWVTLIGIGVAILSASFFDMCFALNGDGALFWPWVIGLFKKVFKNKGKKHGAKFRIVETYKGDALKYHGEQWRKMDSGYHEGFHKWKKMTIEFDTPEEAQSAIEEWREQKRREKHHEVVGEIF